MNNKEIEEKRKLLDELIQNGANYEEILKVSIALDELIEKYYGLI